MYTRLKATPAIKTTSKKKGSRKNPVAPLLIVNAFRGCQTVKRAALASDQAMTFFVPFEPVSLGIRTPLKNASSKKHGKTKKVKEEPAPSCDARAHS